MNVDFGIIVVVDGYNGISVIWQKTVLSFTEKTSNEMICFHHHNFNNHHCSSCHLLHYWCNNPPRQNKAPKWWWMLKILGALLYIHTAKIRHFIYCWNHTISFAFQVSGMSFFLLLVPKKKHNKNIFIKKTQETAFSSL